MDALVTLVHLENYTSMRGPLGSNAPFRNIFYATANNYEGQVVVMFIFYEADLAEHTSNPSLRRVP